jgi:quinolinate synthase
VPGEMFELAMEAQERGQGVVGSTSNILNFILEKAKGAAKREVSESCCRSQGPMFPTCSAS